MRSIQLPLFVMPSPAPATREEAAARRKHKLIKGRPRRLAYGSQVVKVGVRPELIGRVDRVRLMMNATRPEFVRSAVECFTLDAEPTEYVQPASMDGRCDYWKVPISPRTLARLDAIAANLSSITGKRINRQKVMNLAIRRHLERHT